MKDAAYRRVCASAFLINFSERPPRARPVWEGREGWEWAWQSREASSKRTADGSGWRADREEPERASLSRRRSATKILARSNRIGTTMNPSQSQRTLAQRIL